MTPLGTNSRRVIKYNISVYSKFYERISLDLLSDQNIDFVFQFLTYIKKKLEGNKIYERLHHNRLI